MTLRPFSDVIEALRTFAGIYSDKSAACTYFYEGDPECIVGQVIARLGVKPLQTGVYYDADGYRQGDLITADGTYFTAPNSFSDKFDWTLLGIENPTVNEREWVLAVQLAQDHGSSWGRAVWKADDEIGVI